MNKKADCMPSCAESDLRFVGGGAEIDMNSAFGIDVGSELRRLGHIYQQKRNHFCDWASSF